MIVNAPVSVGELVDKITILEIKKEFFTDNKKIENVQVELKHLKEALPETEDIFNEFYSLYIVNKKLWQIEDDIRKKEKLKEFDQEFIELARSVYYTNDIRAELKREINKKVGSTLIEEKQYDDYK
jgi:hypothetical protein